ncbi:MAG: VacJ family lipoprotein [Alphaproteobacteria bacterium]|nr:VacJ family lipoprotein [Alphaproteobacteria bacterium]
MRAILAGLGASLVVTACASTADQQASGVYDPFEGWNRNVYAFNNAVDGVVLEPTAKGYRAITNEPIRAGVRNFLTNLRQPVVFANTVLQGKPDAALDTVGRFLLNTTVGIGGIFDPATALDVPRHREDFGQTLGVWGFDEGAYLMLPFAGPSNVRDAFGLGVDVAFNPMTYAQFEGDDETRIGLGVLGAVSVREDLIEQIEILREQPEPYVALRRNYTQQRQAAIRDGQEEEDPFANLPDFDDSYFGDDEDFN